MHTPHRTGAAKSNVIRAHARITRTAKTRSATAADVLGTGRRPLRCPAGVEMYPSMHGNVNPRLFALPRRKQWESIPRDESRTGYAAYDAHTASPRATRAPSVVDGIVDMAGGRAHRSLAVRPGTLVLTAGGARMQRLAGVIQW
jgi:hypothetical protein